jgi:hypothetical protein
VQRARAIRPGEPGCSLENTHGASIIGSWKVMVAATIRGFDLHGDGFREQKKACLLVTEPETWLSFRSHDFAYFCMLLLCGADAVG